ncbi:MAG: heat-shock protein Hsp20 [Moraxellaceae bacterium]|nr:MAG: heat-shock protein Hsp20 [Moraxellaceae bacterium]
MNMIPRRSIFDLDDFFDPYISSDISSSTGTWFTPRIDLEEKQDRYLITAELPGVKKEDIHITLEDSVLTLEAESHQQEQEKKEGRVIRQERRYGKFLRSFKVGSGVQESDIEASFTDGILTLVAPKMTEVANEKRQINIS